MAWMRLSPLLLCMVAVLLLATGAIGKPIQAPAAHHLVTVQPDGQKPHLTGFCRRIS